MLLNDFYTITDMQQGEGTFSCLALFNKAHDIFKGHFPAQPVVPGVCMMAMVKELLQQQVGTNLLLRHAGNVKFMQLITPEVQPAINITWKRLEDVYNVTASFKSENADLFKLVGTYEIVG